MKAVGWKQERLDTVSWSLKSGYKQRKYRVYVNSRFRFKLLNSSSMSTSDSTLTDALSWWHSNSEPHDRWLTHEQMVKLFTKVNTNYSVIGRSVEGREIREYVLGTGSRGAMLWSQMHGNEATATYALMDLLLYIETHAQESWLADVLRRIHIRVIPMVNPDGAERWSRRTALNIDPNRDAVALSSPETKLLMDRIKASGAEVAFNLHDQRNIFHLEGTDHSAVISFLAPSADASRSVNPTRRKSMNWISHLQKITKQFYEPGAGKYTDEYYPTAFGENVQALGIPTILIESGAAPGDPNRNVARKLNFILLIEALRVLSNSTVLNDYSIADYKAIPHNDNKQWDLKIENVTIRHSDRSIVADLGIRYNYHPDKTTGKLAYMAILGDIGDLSHQCALQTIDAKEAVFENGERLPQLDEAASFTLYGEQNISIKNGVLIP
ncbi:MAG: hypothetical protein EP346_04540 [Bacteroidetes bacterium]|nr:MAG: hypothetical protein EP346_04540 [Bacteroidota bacterium]